MLDGPLLPRRTALVLGAAVVALAGCDGDDSAEPGRVPSATPSVDPDLALVDTVLSGLTRAEQLALGAGLADLAALHRAHIEALDGPPAAPPAGTSKAAVPRYEQRLHRLLVAAAANAESGALARLLASMSAAVGQQLSAGRLA